MVKYVTKLTCAAATTATLSIYFYKKHMYEQEMFNQSGIFVQQGQAFPNFWFIQWIIPYHQSLKIVDKETGTV